MRRPERQYGPEEWNRDPPSRRTRLGEIDGESVNVDRIDNIPNSRFITDNHGNLYFIFGQNCDFIRIPASSAE